MVEFSPLQYGIVKFFNREGLYGFITVVDRDGEPTGEEVHFHYDNGRFPAYRGIFGEHTSGFTTLRFPRPGDGVTFEQKHEGGKSTATWCYTAMWLTMLRTRTLNPLQWRIEGRGRHRTQHGHSIYHTVKHGRFSIGTLLSAYDGPRLFEYELDENPDFAYTYTLQVRHAPTARRDESDALWTDLREIAVIRGVTRPEPAILRREESEFNEEDDEEE